MKLKLHWQILLALIFGGVAGILFPKATPYISWLGDMFVNALSMLIVPIMFFSIVTGISGIVSSGDDLRKLGLRTVGLYLLTMIIAIATGLALVLLIQPGSGILLPEEVAKPSIEYRSIKDIIVGFVPKNIVDALSKNYTLPVILLAFVTGLNVPKLPQEEKKILNHFFKAGFELTMIVTKQVIVLAPIGIFAIVMKQFSGTSDFLLLIADMLKYVLTVTIGLAIHTFVWLPLLLRFVCRVNSWQHFRNMSTPLLTAFSTASSGAALPATLYAVEHKDGISPKVTNFTIPLGSAINMDGAALLECVAVIFIAQAYGIALTFPQTVLIAFTSLLCAIGAAGIPMAALVMMSLILNVAGLPLEGIGLVIGVDRILDMMRSAVNVYGDTCVAVMIAKTENEILPIDLPKNS
ncbi:MAG: dicarboxylate/amino acid:cation symporter [Planctomycetaceae bacterium]|jgi:Na+/H+-dicarboxylate symporter|nr:dicarboxylate/amino acid:cation symporter [Planctomycetaceae bacterium]